MLGNSNVWEKLGRIIVPDPAIKWMVTHTGASFAIPINESSIFNIYVTGRDSKNRSHIGKIQIDIKNPRNVLKISPEPIFSPGELGTFDENGVSYPYIVQHNEYLCMYYVGWMPTVLTGFQNHLGLARSLITTDEFKRVSKAPILPRTNEEPYGTGSACIIKEDNLWRMWYTVWKRWGEQLGEFKHYYIIRYAESNDGINWQRSTHNCIDYKNDNEYAICKPSVIKLDKYHMWYTYRGEQYRIGYAHSNDGINWERADELVKIGVSESGWDSKAISYPYIFKYENSLYMLYCGNEYGKEGLGLAQLKL
ncbi:MAG: hypothetical protein A3B68_04345 [Candidatus Melainabacteria bacterium RIFCSPHIGHO2_02_FULL_34_12]|nr:MAG: hypothetical protein A3B68_04345 [Candidatus Melainabacteria bacterium RIFCSPHIGHO2_02_FULL_34_12]